MAKENSEYLQPAGQPYSLEAEQSLLGCLLVDPSCLPLIQSGGFKAEYLYVPQHRSIYNAILTRDAADGKFDLVTVLEELTKGENSDRDATNQYLNQLYNAIPTTANVEAYANIVRDKFYLRALINASSDVLEKARNEEDDAEKLLDLAEQKIYGIRQGSESNSASRRGEIIVDQVMVRLGQLNSANKEDYLGIPTGYSQLDKMIAGLNRSDLIIVGARPAMGKTSFALNIATNVSKRGKKVLFFSLEMTKEQLASRVISMESRIQGIKMRNGNLEPGDWENLTTTADALHECPLYFDDTSNISVNEMKAKIIRMKDVDCVIIDYLQLMKSPNRTESRVQEVSEITRNLKLMAKDLQVPVIVLAQLARGTEARGKSHRPQLSDLRESGSIEQDADIVLMLYRDDYYADMAGEDNDDENRQIDTVEIIVAKNRHGPTGSVELGWNGEFTTFNEIDRDHDEF